MDIKTITEEKAYQKLTALCARGEHCQYDVLEKMRQWNLDEQVQARMMQRLLAERYVDEERYVRAFTHDKLHYNQWGPLKIEQALRFKHIDKAIIRSILDEIDENEFLTILQPLLLQKRKGISARTPYERNMKLMRWALSRGFTMDQVRSVFPDDVPDF